MKIYLIIVALVVLTGCGPRIKVKDKIEGTWALWKVVTTKKTFTNITGSEMYSFFSDGTYKWQSIGECIIMGKKGYFEITYDRRSESNPFLVLMGIVNPSSKQDAIRHELFEIISISTDSLIIGFKMNLLSDTFPEKWYNRVEYYRRIK